MNIMTIVNFIRAVEPRVPERNLLEPVIKQVELLKKYNLPATFLFQYDSMNDSKYIDAVGDSELFEKGVWLECDETLIKKAGLKWRGREGFSWDFHSHVSMTVGYTPEERIKIIDVVMNRFFEVFGYFPKTVCGWVIDAISLKYLKDKYNIDCSMICKEQWLTDGYSLWGGYYNQAYYPSINNMLCPAATPENQIDIPVFRMLGSDPIDQYKLGIGTDELQGVVSLEPVYEDGGGNEEWIKWFFNEIYKEPCLSFGFTQTGQENSFGWPRMEKGYNIQIPLVKELWDKGKITVMTAGDAGRWYRENYKMTPASNVHCVKNDEETLWYSSKNYRVNIYQDKTDIIIRDIFMFDENYKERYIDDVCTCKNLYYDNLPVFDSFRQSKGKDISKIVFKDALGGEIKANKSNVEYFENSLLYDAGVVKIECTEDKLIIKGKAIMEWSWACLGHEIEVDENALLFKYNGFDYKVKTEGAKISLTENSLKFVPKNDEIVFYMGGSK